MTDGHVYMINEIRARRTGNSPLPRVQNFPKTLLAGPSATIGTGVLFGTKGPG